MTTIASCPPLENKRLVLGVTGSIAAYKAAYLASRFTQAGASVDVILTSSAAKFITALTFQSLTGRPVFTDSDLWGAQAHVLHVGLAKNADALIIAPATASRLAKLAHGLADDLLGLTALSAQCPIVAAAAMDAGMWMNAAVQDNVRLLKKRGVILIDPEDGRLASGLTATGRMAEPGRIFGRLRYCLSRRGPLRGKKFLITAGPTQEPIDPARVLTNRSSGKQGFALAQAALDQGAEVTLIAGPVALATPEGAARLNVNSAQDMADAVLNELERADVLIMAAAVADFKPKRQETKKIKKEHGLRVIELETTADILLEAGLRRRRQGSPKIIIGFAAETENLLTNAKAKMKAKGLDLIVANDVAGPDAGFDVDTNKVTLLTPDRPPVHLPLASKAETAQQIIERAAALLNQAN
ncbi:MAG: bifunctional phosphopantothenoylcysteine decarboxylase/phosphopantothenate--cysteine ligase CoaBC [Elusimicrobia bacterium]|nr:bifunctional phosphopantothenoylcysteine decarboxylase/phosphopantothenate--cysteine ligase CoaBC [Elusimicrobiota bacterium]